MTEEIISPDLLLIGYNKYVAMIAKQLVARKARKVYRELEGNQKRQLEYHKEWVEKKKNDEEYRNKTNEYHRNRNRQIKAKEKNAKLEEKNLENTIL